MRGTVAFVRDRSPSAGLALAPSAPVPGWWWLGQLCPIGHRDIGQCVLVV